MADWVHCNTCYKQPFDIKVQFQLTNCGHIFCEICIKKAPGYCQICKQKCSSILLTNKMKPEVEKFFASPKDMLKQFMQVLDFQDGHRQRLIKHRMSLGASDKQSHESDITAQGFRELQREYQKLREENNRLKQALGAIRSQQTDVIMQSRSSTPHSQVMKSPLRKPTGMPMSQDQRFAGTTPSAVQYSQPVGNNTCAILSQSKARTPSDRISIRTPPVGGVISTPSPCKMYKLTNTGGYPRSQPRQHNEQGMHRPMTQSSPAGSQMRSRSSTPTMSLSRSCTPNRYNSPRDLNSLMSSSQQRQNNNSTPMVTPSNKTPYTSRPDSSTLMQINSTLDPAQRQIRLTYQPRTALMSKVTPRSSQQTA